MHLIFLALLVLSTSSFAETELFSNFSAISNQKTASRNSVTMQPAMAELTVDSSYIIGPGDFFDIMLEKDYLSVQVYPDGSVAIEECGAVNVGGKTLTEARELILDLAAKRYKREECFVQLAVLKQFKVNIMGAVNNIGQRVVEAQTRLSYFIRESGGLLPRANTEDILLIRKGDTLHINFNELSTQGNFDQDIMLEQGDKVFVPFVEIGENISFTFPGYKTSVSYKEGRTLQEYFELAGGFRLHNYGYKAICVREPDKAPRWVKITDMKNTVLAPNTEVEFSNQELLVYVGGAVNFLGRYPYDANWHAIDYAGAAGINTITGSWNQIKVWRGKNPEPLKLSVTEDQILPGDYIEIPKSHYESFKDFTLFIASLLTVVSSAFIIYVNYK